MAKGRTKINYHMGESYHIRRYRYKTSNSFKDILINIADGTQIITKHHKI